jgi:hypothetical protein
MTTSQEPSASYGARNQPGEQAQEPAASASAGADTLDGAQKAASDAQTTASPQSAADSTRVSAGGATSIELQAAEDDSASDNDADNDADNDVDDLDEFDEELDGYEEHDTRSGLTAALSYLHWPPSRRFTYVVGAVVLVIALLLPATLVGIGARGAGPLAVHPTPTITPTATATPPQNVAVQDPLTKRSTRWPERPDCSMRGDGYHITDNTICSMAGPPIRDSYITVTVLQIAGVDDLSYGVTLRRAAEGNYYSFEIDGSGRWYFYKSAVDSNGSPVLSLLASRADNPSINKGPFHANTLQIRATGSRFEFFVNNVKVGQASDSSYAQGTIGLGGNDQLEVVYTDFTLTQSA